MANDWLNSALNIGQDILTMAKGYDAGNTAAVPVPAAKVATPTLVPMGTVAAPAKANQTQTMLLIGAGLVLAYLVLR